jgi:uncharacterized protein (DUF885 family)
MIRRKTWSWVAPAVLSAVVSPALPGTAFAASDAEQQLTRIVEGYFDDFEKLNPISATFNGNNAYNDRLPNSIGPEHIQASLDLEKKYLQDISRVDVNGLSPQARLSYEIFRRARQQQIEGHEFPDQLLPIDQFSGLPLFMPQLGTPGGVQPFNTAKDYDNWLSRIDGFVVWMDQAIANMRIGMKQGVVQPRVVVEKTLPQLEAMVVSKAEDSVFHAPLKSFPDAVSVEDRARLKAALEKAIMEKIVPAYRRVHIFMRDEYLPASRPTIALTALPNGERWYAYNVRVLTTTNMTPAQIHDVGLAEVARIRAEMEKVKAQVGFKGDLAAFFDFMRKDPQFYFEREEQLLDGYRALKAGVAEKLPALFSVQPKADFEIRAVEAFRARSAAGGSYRAASPDGSRPGVFYVNTYDMKARPKYAMDALYLHEAAPGHHFQISIQRELGDLPRFRRFGGYTAYAEGWGLYAESMGKQLGLYQDPYSYFGGLSSEIFRAVRLVVDTGMHSRGWSREQAIEYMMANRPAGETVAISETERYIAIPGQALAYKVGELKIKELRERARAKLGPKFDVREFHTQVLIDGALPLDVLEDKIDRWIAAKQKS